MARNRYGRAGRSGVPSQTVAAFFDFYSYEGYNPSPLTLSDPDDHGRAKRINGQRITDNDRRTIRRWRNQPGLVGPDTLARVLDDYGFDLAWFHGWCKLHRKPVT